jgi:RNA polymerase sigma-70 factor (ECF subfamily)
MSEKYTQLLKRCRKHDERAMRALYEEMAPMAMGVCMRYSHNREEAQDLMQDGFVKVFEKLDSLKDPERVGAWIHQIMVNVCIDSFHSRKELRFLDDMVVEPVTLPLDPFGMEAIVAAMQKLPPHQQVVFNLVEVEGYSCEEVAQRLGQSASGVRATLSRAKAALREELIDKNN